VQAVLLATATGPRLEPLSRRVPAPLLPVANRPVMELALEVLARAGCKDVLVCLGQGGGGIEAFLGSGRRFGIRPHYIYLPELRQQKQDWGSAGALRWLADQITETTVLLPAEQLVDLDLSAALAYHREHGSLVTMVVGRPAGAGCRPVWVEAEAGATEAESRPGKVVVGVTAAATMEGAGATGASATRSGATGVGTVSRPDSGRVVGLGAEPAAQRGACLWAATGIYIIEPAVLTGVPENRPYDFYGDVLPALLKAGQAVNAYVLQGYWNPLDSFAAYQAAQAIVLRSALVKGQAPAAAEPGALQGGGNGNPELPGPDGGGNGTGLLRDPYLPGRQVAPGIWVGRNAAIHPTVRLAPPVCLGDDCQVGRNVDLGPEAVIGSNVIIDDEATICHSTVLDQTYVGRLVNIDQRIVDRATLMDVTTGEVSQVVDSFLLGETTAASISSILQRVRDFCLAGLLLVLTLPAWLVLLIANTLLAGGRPLCRVLRVGRTPGEGAAAGQVSHGAGAPTAGILRLTQFRTQRADGSFTAFGRWFRRWELYRWPEMWDVLAGNLALVGVQPLTEAEAAQITEDWQQKRYEGPAGFSGPWYVQAPPNDLDAAVVADTYYVATRSGREDWRLLAATPAAWWRRTRKRL
jgi:NDP-sugar pyrophosphorylase family protein